MSTKSMLKAYIVERGGFTKEIHPMVESTLKVISGEVPERLKMSITLSELITFTSHLRKNIILHDGTEVPCNAIVFALSGSGTAKDSSMNMVRKALSPGYKIIDKIRKEGAKERAEKQALLDGKPKAAWLDYYEKPKDLAAGLGTVEGLVKHFHSLEAGRLGAGSINSSEIGNELMSNKEMTEIVKTISIAYDLGKIPAKIIKSSENQTDAINCLPVNALFFGSESAILHNTAIKEKFKTMATTQLGRRTIFSFTPEDLSPPQFKTPEEVFEYREAERHRTIEAQELIADTIVKITTTTDKDPLVISEEAQKLFDVYKEFNALESLTISSQYPISKLARKHKQWLALKLSGNYAILSGNTKITEENYIQALNTIELFSEDLMNFETELVKEPYEVFAEFCKHNAEDGKFTVSLHVLRKLGYIPMTGTAKSKVEELVHLVSSYDNDAIYTACAEGICYEEQIKTEVIGISYLEVSGTKQERAWQCEKGFEFMETNFEDLSGLLSDDYVYTSFEFINGKRSQKNVCSGTKVAILDIDDSTITDEECHLMLEGINHHIARTSDSNNAYKFRVIVELDAIVDLEDRAWPLFMKEVGNYLGLNIDIHPKAQIYFAYKDRVVLSEINGEPLETRELISNASLALVNKPKPIKLSSKEQQAKLDDPLETFARAFNCANGRGSLELITAAKYAKDLQATKEYIIDLMYKINNYWTNPMDETRLEKTIISQIIRWV